MRNLLIALCCAVVLSACSSVTPELRQKSADMTMTLLQTAPAVTDVAISPDNRFALSGNIKKVAVLWDLSLAAAVKTFKTSTNPLANIPVKTVSSVEAPLSSRMGVSFTPDSRYILTASDGLKLWNVATGLEERLLDKNRIVAMAWSPVKQQLLTMGYADAKDFLYPEPDCTTMWNWNGGNVSRAFHECSPEDFFRDSSFHVASIAVSPDGRYAFTGSLDRKAEGFLHLIDLDTGKQIKSKSSSCYRAVAFSPDGKSVVTTGKEDLNYWEIPSLQFVWSNSTSNFHYPNSVVYSPDGKFVLTGGEGDGVIRIWDAETHKLARTITAHPASGHTFGVTSLKFFKNGKYLVSGGDASMRIWDFVTGEEIATFISFEDGEWLVMTPNGYYNSSEKGDQHLKVTVGGQPYTISQLRESFYRPDLVKVALSGGSLNSFRKLAEIKPPPTVTIVDTPASIGTLETTVTVKVIDAGGGIGDIRLYLNGSAVVLDSSRGITVTPTKDTGAMVKKYTVKLGSGTNSIRAIAFNGDNSMQSSDATFQIVSTYKAPTRPSLHALVIGVNQYKNPKLQLNYAVADAKLFADTLQHTAAPLFDQIKVKQLLTSNETTRENILKELRSYRDLNPDDLFVFYVASHGTVDDGEYFLLSSNVGSISTARLKSDAISQHAIKEIVANIPTTKKLIFIDTCSAGHLGDAIQTAMLTRGMSEDTAIKVLSRAVGSTILSASTSVQEALEGYQGHGLFTYVLADGMKGKADKGKTGFIKTTELADYVDNEVPALAERVFKRAQYPTISISGQAFPIGQVK